MPHSMTGFGAADGVLEGAHVAVEVRSVNHRHLHVQCRLPGGLQALESAVRNRVRQRLQRGHVSVAASWVDQPERAVRYRVDVARATAMRDAMGELAAALNLEGGVDLAFLARQPDVLVPDEAAPTSIDESGFMPILDRALDGLIATRSAEGDALRSALLGSVEIVERELAVAEARAPERFDAERARLRRLVDELLNDRALGGDRLELEIVLLADKLDITEETVRLRAHLEATRAALNEHGAVGKRFTFLGQEMLREVNTIGSKAQDATIASAVIAMKTELERIREQVENLE